MPAQGEIPPLCSQVTLKNWKGGGKQQDAHTPRQDTTDYTRGTRRLQTRNNTWRNNKQTITANQMSPNQQAGINKQSESGPQNETVSWRSPSEQDVRETSCWNLSPRSTHEDLERYVDIFAATHFRGRISPSVLKKIKISVAHPRTGSFKRWNEAVW